MGSSATRSSMSSIEWSPELIAVFDLILAVVVALLNKLFDFLNFFLVYGSIYSINSKKNNDVSISSLNMADYSSKSMISSV